jgi:hypothetical protein
LQESDLVALAPADIALGAIIAAQLAATPG